MLICIILVDISGKNPFYSVLPDCSIIVALELLSNAGIHRVNIMNEEGEITGLLSQSDILNYIAANELFQSPIVKCSVRIHTYMFRW